MKHSAGIFFSVVTFCFMFLYGCDQSAVFESNQKINQKKWYLDDTVTFYTNIADTSYFYDLNLNIRNGGSYRYSNLFLFVRIMAPTGNSITDTVEVTLANSQGEWLGEGLGDIKSRLYPFRSGVKFACPGIYKFQIVQGMRQNPLEQIFDLGLQISKSSLDKE